MKTIALLPLLILIPGMTSLAGCDRGSHTGEARAADAPTAGSATPAPRRDPACQSHPDGIPFCEGARVRVCRGGRPQTASTCWSIERCDAGTCLPSCPEGEVYIPATGPQGFTMGRDKMRGKDKPHAVVLTRPFCMDETEVTTAAYTRCIEAGACEEPYKWDPWASYPRFPDQPVNLVSQPKAHAYCAWRKQALPTEAQWEWAATGGDGREWPWGNEEPTCESGQLDFTPFGAPKSAPGGDVGCHGGGPSAVKAHPKGAKEWPDGKLYDLGGNVWEWTRDFAQPYPTEPQTDPVVTEVSGKPDWTVFAIRGGGWNRSATGCTVWFRGEATRNYQVPGLGFRCIREAIE